MEKISVIDNEIWFFIERTTFTLNMSYLTYFIWMIIQNFKEPYIIKKVLSLVSKGTPYLIEVVRGYIELALMRLNGDTSYFTSMEDAENEEFTDEEFNRIPFNSIGSDCISLLFCSIYYTARAQYVGGSPILNLNTFTNVEKIIRYFNHINGIFKIKIPYKKLVMILEEEGYKLSNLYFALKYLEEE